MELSHELSHEENWERLCNSFQDSIHEIPFPFSLSPFPPKDKKCHKLAYYSSTVGQYRTYPSDILSICCFWCFFEGEKKSVILLRQISGVTEVEPVF